MEEFDDWIGKEFWFYGVDGNSFKLDDTAWEAEEDEDDGYRSYLRTVRRDITSHLIFFHQPLARVRIVHGEDDYSFVDVLDSHLWLNFGTNYIQDSYYPFFFFTYYPKETPMKERTYLLKTNNDATASDLFQAIEEKIKQLIQEQNRVEQAMHEIRDTSSFANGLREIILSALAKESVEINYRIISMQECLDQLKIQIQYQGGYNE